MSLQPDTASADNPLMMQFFTWDSKHASLSWWKHFEEELPRLAQLGITQVWLPPPNKAAEPNGRGYDAYDLWDLGEFEQKGTVATRWGTRDELLSACSVARSLGVQIIIDAVLNHKLGADRTESFPAVTVDPQNRLKALSGPQTIEGWTAFDFPDRGNKYSSLKWTQAHFSGLDWDQKEQKNGIYRIAGKGHAGWSKYVDSELGNYDYLLGIDIDHRHPDVQADLFAWGSWILKETGAVGFRLDAIKHMDRRFLLEFLRRTRASASQNMFAVSEYWSADLRRIEPYIRAFNGETSFFDVPLHYRFHQASTQGASYDLRMILDDTLVKKYPQSAVTFVDNHDTVVGQSLQSWVGHNFKLHAYALILLRGPGYPCVFYGDTYPNEEGYSAETASSVTRLLEARKRFAYGPTLDFFQHRNCIGFARQGDAGHEGCVVVLNNSDPGKGKSLAISIRVGKDQANSTYVSFLDSGSSVDIDADGVGSFACLNGAVDVWTKLKSD